ncbi:SHOCT domain-containing protein [Natrialba sp. PRR66]|uniref:SHOCT domain-containing protein n=1 Tax=Natrialba sp. PRR66 TaxID=3098146 RepID=UPI002B1D9982|nr:SHOCT domain-containing protein [Natrialba sp. PRR66]
MDLPDRFRDLPAWAAVLASVLGLLVVLTGLSMVLGIVFAGIAVGMELGSPMLGVLAALLGLAIVTVPTIAVVLALRGGEDERDGGHDARSDDASDDRVATLRERYMAGEIDDETFEQRIDELLSGTDATTAGTEREPSRGHNHAADHADETRTPERER